MSRDLILLALSLMTWGLGEGMFLLFQPLYLQELGASPLAIGQILGGVGLAMAVAHTPAGHLADRFGRRPLIWLAWIGGLAAAWMMALANSLPLFVLGMIFYGLTAFVMAPMNAYITEARGKLSVGRAITLISASYNLGAILGPWLGGQISARLGLHSVYKIAAVIFVFSVLIILLIRPQPVSRPAPAEVNRRSPLNRHYLAYLGIVFLASFSCYLPQPLSPNFLRNERSLGLEQIGQLGSISSLGIVILNLALGSLDARLGFLAGQLCLVGFSLLILQGKGLAAYALGYFLAGGYRVVRSLAVAQTRELVSPSRLGLAYGITETIGASVMVFAPPLAGWLYEAGPERVYLVALVLIPLAILLSLLWQRSRQGANAADQGSILSPGG